MGTTLSTEQRELIVDSEISAIVYGRGDAFVLIRLDVDSPSDATALQDVINRGLPFVGVLGYRNGRPEVKLQPGAAALYTLMFAGVAFAHDIAAHIRLNQGDAVSFLERLHSLPDERS